MSKMFLWAITSALAGFLFGFDTVVISGAEAKIQNLWSLSGAMHGFAISSALWGTVLGALIGGWPTNKFGRKNTLMFNGVLFLVSAIGSALAWEVWSFSFFRFIGGLGIGISTIAAPLFISEISPAKDRGKLTALFQFNIVFGILMAFLSNYLVGKFSPDEYAWRIMLGMEAVPSVIYMFMCLTLPESPRYLITVRNELDKAREVFKLINVGSSEKEIDTLVSEVRASAAEEKNQASVSEAFSRRLMLPMLFAFLIAAFNQLSGINIILYFAPRLLGLAGVSDPLSAAIALGATNLVFTYLGVKLIDLLGRRTLLLIGCVGYLISLGVCTFAFLHFTDLKVVSNSIDMSNAAQAVMQIDNPNYYMTDEDRAVKKEEFALNQDKFLAMIASDNTAINAMKTLSDVNLNKDSAPADFAKAADAVKAYASEQLGFVSTLVLGCIMLFIAAHALGSGTIIWVFVSEIFPARFRAAGQALGSFTHWIFAAGLTLVFPIFIANFDVAYMFGLFFIMMAAQLCWALFIMPETKGKTLEELSANLMKKEA